MQIVLDLHTPRCNAKIILKNKNHILKKKNDSHKRNHKFSQLMINSKKLLKFLEKKDVKFYTGVPDSVLKNFTNLLSQKILTY